MSKQKLFKLSFVLVFGLTAALISWGNRNDIQEWLGGPEESAVYDDGRRDSEQIVLVREMQSLLERFDNTHTKYSLSAVFTAIDKRDSLNAFNDLPYIFHRNGNATYLRFGNTETINNEEASLYIDHAAGIVIIGAPKKLIQPAMLPLNEVYDLIKDENYTLSKKENADRSIIYMRNETHLSCKELQIEYNPSSRFIESVFVRIPDISDHLNADKEKIIKLTIKQYKESADDFLMDTQKYVSRLKNDEWSLAPGYKNYRLIVQ